MFKQISGDQEETVNIILNGQPLQVQSGITVAAIALSQNQKFTRTTPISGSKRGPFCMMGVCYECLMVIDGKANQRACATYVQSGMTIDRQQGVGPAMESNGSE
jgi:predicted molibdopterin-dependent oxidoreductase YjgC